MSETYKRPEQIKFPDINLLIKTGSYETDVLKYTDTGTPSVILVKFKNGQSFVLKCQTDDIHCNIKNEIRAMESLYKYISIPKGQLQDIERGIITTNKNNEIIIIYGNFLVMEAIQKDFMPAERFLRQGHDPEKLARAVDQYLGDLFIMYKNTHSIIHTNIYGWERNFTRNFWPKYTIDPSKKIIVCGKIYPSLQTNNFQIQERLNGCKSVIGGTGHGDSGLQNIFARTDNYKAGNNYVAIDPKNKIIDITDDLSRLIAGLFLYYINVTNQYFTENSNTIELNYTFTETSYHALNALLPVFTKYIRKLEEFYNSMDVECNFWDMWYLNMVRVVTNKIPKPLESTTNPKTVATLAILTECFHTKSLHPILSHRDPLADYPREFLYSGRKDDVTYDLNLDLPNTLLYLEDLGNRSANNRDINKQLPSLNEINNSILTLWQNSNLPYNLKYLQDELGLSDNNDDDDTFLGEFRDEILFHRHSLRIQYLQKVCEVLLANEIQLGEKNTHQFISDK